MKNKLLNMTEGNIWSGVLKFSLPLMLSQVLQVMFNMSDIAVVGKFAGSISLGSVGSTALIVSLYTGFLIGIGSGINSVAARYYGAQNEKAVSESVHTSLIVSLVIGIIILAGGIISAESFLKLIRTKDELIDGAVLYLRIYLIGMPAVAVFNFGNGVLSAVGNTTKPLVILIFAGVINVIMNIIFVVACGWDVAGVASASVISQYVSAILVLAVLFRSRGSYGLSLGKLKITPDKAWLVLSLGVPSGCQNSIFAIANLFIQSAVNSFDHIMVEGNSAAANADQLVYDMMAAIYVACTSYIAQNDGAGKKNRILKSYYVSLIYSFGFGMLFGVTLVLFGRGFLSLFTNDAEVVEAGLNRLTIMGLSYGFSAFMDNTIAASRGLGKTLVPTVIVIIGSCFFRVAWVYTVFAYFKTIRSLYLLYIFSWTITAVAEIIYFARIYKKNMKASLTK